MEQYRSNEARARLSDDRREHCRVQGSASAFALKCRRCCSLPFSQVMDIQEKKKKLIQEAFSGMKNKETQRQKKEARLQGSLYRP